MLWQGQCKIFHACGLPQKKLLSHQLACALARSTRLVSGAGPAPGKNLASISLVNVRHGAKQYTCFLSFNSQSCSHVVEGVCQRHSGGRAQQETPRAEPIPWARCLLCPPLPLTREKWQLMLNFIDEVVMKKGPRKQGFFFKEKLREGLRRLVLYRSSFPF